MILNPCQQCGGRGYRTVPDPRIPGVDHFRACGSCFGSGRDQSHVEDTLPALSPCSVSASRPIAINTTQIRSAYEQANREKDDPSRLFQVTKLFTMLPNLCDEVDRLREEIRSVRGQGIRSVRSLG